jgi:hypothetical protein
LKGRRTVCLIEEAVLHLMGWVGRRARCGRFVDSRLLGRIEGPTLNLAGRIELTEIGGCADG